MARPNPDNLQKSRNRSACPFLPVLLSWRLLLVTALVWGLGRECGWSYPLTQAQTERLTRYIPKALAKLQRFPGLFDGTALQAARDLYAYDNAFTAPLHGFADTEDYWARCSAKPGLRTMRDVPALVLNARNDPFVPAHCLPLPTEVGSAVTLWQPDQGGHVGFPSGAFPGHVADLPDAVGRWLAQHL